MPAVDQRKQRQTGGGNFTYEETPAQRRGWQNVRAFIEDHEPELIKDDTFTLKGRIKKMLLDEKDGVANYFYKDVTRDGKKVEWPYVKVVAHITDERVCVRNTPLELPVKDVGANFFDGYGRDGKRSLLRGGMYWVHLGVTHQEPPKELVDGTGTWETEDYEDQDVLLVITYAGDTEDDRYADRRDGLALWLGGPKGIVERDPEASHIKRPDRAARRLMVTDPEPEEVEEQQDPQPRARGGSGRTTGRSTTTSGRAAGRSGRGDDDEPPFSTAGEDSPTRGRRSATSAGAAADAPATAGSTTTTSGADPSVALSTERQQKFIRAVAREAGLDEQKLEQWASELFGLSVAELNRRDASDLIKTLQRRRNEVA